MDFIKVRWKCMIGGMLLALFSGIGYAWSVFQSPMMAKFDWSLSAISITFTIQVLTSTISPIFIGRLQKKLGVVNYLRIGIVVYALGLAATSLTTSLMYFYIVFGLIVGLAIGMLYPCLMAYCTSLFPDKSGLASGLLAFSYGCGAVIWAPTVTSLTGSYGITSVYLILAVLFGVVMIPLTFLLKKVPEDFKPESKKVKSSGNIPSAVKDYTWQEMLRTHVYYFLVLALTLGTTSGLMITGHASNIFQETLGLTAERAAFFVGLIAIFNSLGRLTFGTLSDYLGRYNCMLAQFAIVCAAMLLLTVVSGPLFIAAIFAIAACYGGFTSMISPVCKDNFGLKNLAVNYTFLYVAYGLAGVIGPQLASTIRTSSGTYTSAFLTVAVMSVVGFLLILFLKLTDKSTRKVK